MTPMVWLPSSVKGLFSVEGAIGSAWDPGVGWKCARPSLANPHVPDLRPPLLRPTCEELSNADSLAMSTRNWARLVQGTRVLGFDVPESRRPML